MQVFIWYSKSTEDSGKKIAELLSTRIGVNKVSHGITPPKGFKGLAICYGAKPIDKFAWKDRDFRAIFNDPRIIEKSKKTKPVNPPANLDQNNRIRLFFASNGGQSALNFIGGMRLAQAEGTPTTVAAKIIDSSYKGMEAGARSQAIDMLAKLVQDGRIKLTNFIWSNDNIQSNEINAASPAAQRPGVHFCAIDLVPGALTPAKVTFAPEFVEGGTVFTLLIDYLEAFVKKHSRSAKEILTELVSNVDDEEADALLEGLRELRNKTA